MKASEAFEGFILRQWYLGRVTGKYAFSVVGIKLLSNGTAAAGVVGGAFLGAKIGAVVGIAGGTAFICIHQIK